LSEYEAIRSDLDALASSMERYAAAVGTYTEAASGEIQRLWADNAELRDELHAVANRVETLTRARLTEPAEVAERMQDAANVRRMAKEYE
jgi:Tfp pilus assembly protein PilE